MAVSVLVIEDDTDFRDSVREILEKAGYSVRVAADGAEGLRALRDGPVDLILLDLMLPNINGWEFLAERATHSMREEWRNVRVIAMSALRDLVQDVPTADAYLPKPFSRELLLETVRGVLQQSPSENGRDDSPAPE